MVRPASMSREHKSTFVLHVANLDITYAHVKTPHGWVGNRARSGSGLEMESDSYALIYYLISSDVPTGIVILLLLDTPYLYALCLLTVRGESIRDPRA